MSRITGPSGATRPVAAHATTTCIRSAHSAASGTSSPNPRSAARSTSPMANVRTPSHAAIAAAWVIAVGALDEWDQGDVGGRGVAGGEDVRTGLRDHDTGEPIGVVEGGEVVSTAVAVVDPHPHLDRPRRQCVEVGPHVAAGVVLGGDRHRVLEVEDDGIGPGGQRLVEAVGAVSRDVQVAAGHQRAPTA